MQNVVCFLSSNDTHGIIGNAIPILQLGIGKNRLPFMFLSSAVVSELSVTNATLVGPLASVPLHVAFQRFPHH